MNSGIKLYETTISDIWNIITNSNNLRDYPYNMFLFNFPSNYIDIDVSREKINDFTKCVEKNNFSFQLINEIFNQVLQYFELAKEDNLLISAHNMYSLMICLATLCKDLEEYKQLKNKIMNDRYVLFIRHNADTIDLIINHNYNKPNNSIIYSKNNINKYKEEFSKFLKINNIDLKKYDIQKILDKFYFLFREFNYLNYDNYLFEHNYRKNIDFRYFRSDEKNINIEEKMLTVLNFKKANWCYGILILIQAYLFEHIEIRYIDLMNIIFISLLQRYNISDIEQDRAVLTISKTDLDQIFKMIIPNS